MQCTTTCSKSGDLSRSKLSYVYIYIIINIYTYIIYIYAMYDHLLERWHTPSSRHLWALLSVCGRCSFGVLFSLCASVCVVVGGVVLCRCVCVWPVDLFTCSRSSDLSRSNLCSNPTCWIDIHIFLWRNHKHMNSVFRLVNPIYDMDTCIFKVTVFTKQAKYE